MTATPSTSADLQANVLGGQRPNFLPPWVFRNNHFQTLAGAYVFGRWRSGRLLPTDRSSSGEVLVDNDDRLAFQDDCPAGWVTGDRVVVLGHGLSGSHASPYMVRIAHQLYSRGVRTVRLDWRGSGAGVGLARYPYHSGRSDDLRATILEVGRRCPGSPISVVGFSMGGNITLKMLGEAGARQEVLPGVDRAVSVCPPIDLATTIDFLKFGLARWYDAYFAKSCTRDVRYRKRVRPDAIIPEGWFNRPPRTMHEFDDTFTAPVCGFASADDYYRKCSAKQFLPTIKIPTLILATKDDPVVPYTPFEDAVLSEFTELHATRYGGHMGFVATRGVGWMDQQVISWIMDGM
ncbi:YheT family hydrolase [Schlesneria paludicola]|uniref:YheT family hydrolase n=1 Tax=Schlesneria paludicola TaxID=360056 RepID=UPI00029A949F|nr:alpha/beta fold hydrolase [Schlesneria paludicola]